MPLGHLGVNRYDLIDIGECGLFVTTCNRHYGHAYVGKRAVKDASISDVDSAGRFRRFQHKKK